MLVVDIVKQLYGCMFFRRVNPLVSSIGLTATRIARADPARAFLSVTNNSVNTIYIHTDHNVSSTLGYILAPGDTLIINTIDDNMAPTYEYYAVADAINSNITVYEQVIFQESKT